MDSVLMNADDWRKHDNGAFEVQVGDKNFNFATITFDDAEVTGAQVATAADKHPVEDHVVFAASQYGRGLNDAGGSPSRPMPLQRGAVRPHAVSG